MWSILRATDRLEVETAVVHRQPHASTVPPERVAAASDRDAVATVDGCIHGNGTASDAEPARDDDHGLVRVYLHPGRAYLGSMDRLRAIEQFDFGDSRAFDSVGEAESACNGRAGFLVEAPADGPQSPRGRVRFARRLRD